MKTELFDFTGKDDIHWIWPVMGWIFSIVGAGIPFLLFYEFFFARDLYLNRKQVIKYLQKHKDYTIQENTCLTRKEIKLRDGTTIYIWCNGVISVHNGGLCISNFVGSLIGKIQYNKLKKLVKEA